MGEAWWQEREVSGHMTPTVRMPSKMDAGAQHVFSLSSLGSQLLEGCRHIDRESSCSLNPV